MEPLFIAPWSKPVSDNRGYTLRARWIVGQSSRVPGRREYPLYVELEDAGEAIGNGMRIFFDPARLRCALRDRQGRSVANQPMAFSGAVPGAEWVTLPADASIRLRVSPFGIHRPDAIALCPGLGQLWILSDRDRNEYILSGTLTIEPPADQQPPSDPQIWRGTLVLPELRFVPARGRVGGKNAFR